MTKIKITKKYKKQILKIIYKNLVKYGKIQDIDYFKISWSNTLSDELDNLILDFYNKDEWLINNKDKIIELNLGQIYKGTISNEDLNLTNNIFGLNFAIEYKSSVVFNRYYRNPTKGFIISDIYRNFYCSYDNYSTLYEKSCQLYINKLNEATKPLVQMLKNCKYVEDFLENIDNNINNLIKFKRNLPSIFSFDLIKDIKHLIKGENK